MLCSDGNQHRRCLLPRNSGDLQAMIFSYIVFVCLQTRSKFCAMIFQARKLRQLFDFHPILTLGKSKKKFLSLQTSRLLSSVKYFALLISFFSLSEIFFFPFERIFSKEHPIGFNKEFRITEKQYLIVRTARSSHPQVLNTF